jgi:uroporphyrinogen-III synthase
MTVLLTRPLADSQRIADELQTHGVASMIWPMTRVELATDPIPVPGHITALVFTSSHAVRAFVANHAGRDFCVFCVGDRTAGLASDAGFADVQAASGDFTALVDLLRQQRPESVLYLRGREISADLEAALIADDIRCESRIVYAAVPGGPPEEGVNSVLCSGGLGAITVWSRRNAELLRESILKRKDWRITETDLVAISDNAATPLGIVGFRRIIVASRPNATQMIAEIRAAVR